MFDYDKIGSSEIVTRFAGEGEKMTTLDDKEKPEVNGHRHHKRKRAGALAGVMGETFPVTDETTNVVINLLFNPVSVRKTSGRLNLRSEASSRFEKGVSHEFVLPALERAATCSRSMQAVRFQPGIMRTVNWIQAIQSLKLHGTSSITDWV